MATNDTPDENGTEPEQIDTPCMGMKMWQEPTEATVEVKPVGGDAVQILASEDFRTNVQLILSDEDARELVSDLEDAIATETK